MARKEKNEEEPEKAGTVNTLEIQEPGTSGEVLRQQKIKAFFDAREAYKAAERKFHDAYRQVSGMVMSGAEIQPGRYGLKYGVKIVRRRSYKQDIIDLKGQSYQIRLLESAPKYAQFYVRVKPPKP